jgi:hypothetical protein
MSLILVVYSRIVSEKGRCPMVFQAIWNRPPRARLVKNKMHPGKDGSLMDDMSHRSRRVLYYICRTFIVRKDGRRDYARDHGFKAWRIPVYAT